MLNYCTPLCYAVYKYSSNRSSKRCILHVHFRCAGGQLRGTCGAACVRGHRERRCASAQRRRPVPHAARAHAPLSPSSSLAAIGRRRAGARRPPDQAVMDAAADSGSQCLAPGRRYARASAAGRAARAQPLLSCVLPGAASGALSNSFSYFSFVRRNTHAEFKSTITLNRINSILRLPLINCIHFYIKITYRSLYVTLKNTAYIL